MMEARQFFADNNNQFAFASNYFGETKNAVNFVEALYAAGAYEVTVDGIYAEEWRITGEGGPYADTLFITAFQPVSPVLLNLILNEHPDEASVGGRQGVAKDYLMFRLWWD